MLRIPVWSSDERGRRVPVSVVAVCRRRQRPEWTWSLGPVKCVDGNKWRQLSLVSWRGAVVERRSVYSCSRRHCVWWTTRSEEHCQHWSLFRVVKLICLTALLFEHLWNLGLQYIDSARIDFRVWVIAELNNIVCLCCMHYASRLFFIKKLLENLLMCEWCETYWCVLILKMLLTRDICIYAPFWKLTYRSDPSTDFHAWCIKRSGLAQRCLFWGFVHMTPHLGAKTNFWALIGVFKPNSWNQKTCIISKLLHRFQPNFAQW